MNGHFTIDPSRTHVRIVVKQEYASLQQTYIETGDRDAFQKMIDCISAELEAPTNQSFRSRCADMLRAIGHWLWIGLEWEGIAMYPAAYPPSVYDTLLGRHDPDTYEPRDS